MLFRLFNILKYNTGDIIGNNSFYYFGRNLLTSKLGEQNDFIIICDAGIKNY
jgi:hypothetical protein